MTNEIAIDVLKEICIKNKYTGYPFEAINTAIETLEKQTPNRPSIKCQDLGIFGEFIGYVCGCCGASVRYRFEYKEPIDLYCWNCGQAIDWSEGEQ